MNAQEMRALATTFSNDLTASQLAKQGQSLLAIAENLEAALAVWKAIAAVTEGFRVLKIDLGPAQHHIEVLKQTPHTAVKDLILLPAPDLAKRPASTFREHDRNAAEALQLLMDRWTSWSNEALASLAVLEPLLDRVPALTPLKPKIVALRRERRSEPPSGEDDVKAVGDWLKRCADISAEANRSLEAGVAAFIKEATKGEGIWLDRVSPTTLAWILDNDLAKFLRVKFYEVGNPEPMPRIPQQPSPASEEDDDWP